MTQTDTFPSETIILVPDALRLILQQRMLKRGSGQIGITLISLSAWRRRFSLTQPPSRASQLLSFRHTLLPHRDDFPIFGSLFEDTAFLEECRSFLCELKRHDVPLDSLPQQSGDERELFRILSLLEDLPSDAQGELEAYAAIQKETDFSHIRIYPAFFSLEEQRIVNLLLDKGAQMMACESSCTQRELYRAVNMRQEIEAIAQMIIQRDWDAEDIALCALDPFYAQLAEQIFSRYEIPYTLLSASSRDPLAALTQAWLNWRRSPCTASLQALCDCDAFAIDCSALLQLLDTFSIDVHDDLCRSQHVGPSVLFDEEALKRLRRLEEQAAAIQQQILPQLDLIRDCPLDTLFTHVSERCAERFSAGGRTALQGMQAVQEVLEAAWPHLHSEDDLPFIIRLLDDIRLHSAGEQLRGVIIHGMKELFYERPIRFLCGATMNAWPGFVPHGGIFDEKLREALPLPSMDERYAHHLAQCGKYRMAQQTLIALYPQGTYEGKSNEASLEIEQMMKAHADDPIPLLQPQAVHRRITPTHHLNADLARRLYLRDHVLYGSISAFERYRGCPFSYFLRYGLSLKRSRQQIDETSLGALVHHLLEELCAQMGKQYAQADEQQLIEMISSLFKEAETLFPDRHAQHEQMKAQLLVQMKALLARLKALEEHSALSPRLLEQPFTFRMDLEEEDAQLCMSGVIDRIDAAAHMGVILDYKSSRKTLSETKVYSGRQLQLPVYALALHSGMIPESEDILDVMGVFYLSTKQESITQEALKISRVKKTCDPVEEEDVQAQLDKAHRLNGWIFSTNISAFDDDGTHVAGLKQDKEGNVVLHNPKQTLRELQPLDEGMKRLLSWLAQRILSGAIECEPDEDACTYCDFHDICRYHGQPYVREAIITRAGTYAEGKEEQHAEVE